MIDLSQYLRYAGHFCDGTRRYGVPAPFSNARKKLFLCVGPK